MASQRQIPSGIKAQGNSPCQLVQDSHAYDRHHVNRGIDFRICSGLGLNLSRWSSQNKASPKGEVELLVGKMKSRDRSKSPVGIGCLDVRSGFVARAIIANDTANSEILVGHVLVISADREEA